jgi:ATP-binding protein involved in chromosome partitioning
VTTNPKLNNNFKRIILFSSLNGGTGKSFISEQISSLLSTKCNVGLLDADINSIGLTYLLKLFDKRLESITDSHGYTLVEPYSLNNTKFISAGLLDIGEDLTGLRGGLLSGICRLFINDVNWGELDYLLIDLPSGLSDIELTLLDDFQNVEILFIGNGNVFADERKLKYYLNRNVKILGLLYNKYSPYLDCTKKYYDLCNNNNITFLETFPFISDNKPPNLEKIINQINSL